MPLPAAHLVKSSARPQRGRARRCDPVVIPREQPGQTEASDTVHWFCSLDTGQQQLPEVGLNNN